MAVKIQFESAGLEEVRQQMNRLVEDARRGVSIPVTAAGGGGAGGGVPTAAGVLGPSRGPLSSAVASEIFGLSPTAFAPGGGPNTATIARIIGGGGGANIAPLASPGFFWGAGVSAAGGPPTVGSVLGGGGGGDDGGGGGGGGGGSAGIAPSGAGPGSFGRPFFSRGFGRAAGFGYVAHTVFAALEAGREYNVASVLGGSDQRAQTEATLAYRQRLISAGGWVGQAVGYLQDPSGMGEAAVTATLRGGSATDTQTDAMRGNSNFAFQQAGRAYTSADVNPFQRRLREAKVAHDEELRMLEERRRKQSAVDEEAIQAEKVRLAATRGERAAGGAGGVRASWAATAFAGVAGGALGLTTNDALARLEAEDATRISQMRGERSAAYERTYGAPGRALADEIDRNRTREINRDESFRLRSVFQGYGFDVLESANEARGALTSFGETANLAERQSGRRLASGRRFAGDMTRLGRERAGFGEFAGAVGTAAAGAIGDFLVEQRENFDLRMEQTRRLRSEQYELSADLALVERDPLNSRLRRLQGQRDRALNGKEGAERQTIIDDFKVRDFLIRREDTENRAFQREALTGQSRSLALQLADQPTSAIANNIGTTARITAGRMLQDSDSNRDNARLVIQNAISSLQLTKKSFLEQNFQPTQIDAALTAFNGPRVGGEDPITALNSIKNEIAGLRSDLAGGGITVGD
jgi:hypothetical protein